MDRTMTNINNPIDHDDEGESLAEWLQANFKGQQRTGGQVVLTDTQEKRR